MEIFFEDVYSEYLKYLYLKNKITTIELIKLKFKNHILPYFGTMNIYKITKNDYIDFQIKLRELNYSDSFYEQVHIMLKKFFDYLKVNYDVDNIPRLVGSVRSNNIKNQIEKETWTNKEFKKFIRCVDNNIYHALFNLLFFTGIRKGEAMALKISDLTGDYININKTITKELYNGKRLLLPPKSKKSIRKIRIDRLTRRELNKLIKYYTKNFDNYNKDFFLFGGLNPIPATTLERKKNYYCKIAGVKQIRIHDFRHSHATILYKNNINIKSIQNRLGHADISTTLNTYIHLDKREEKKLIHTINFLHF